MKLKKIVFCFLAASIFASCTTTKVDQTEETTVEKKVETQKKQVEKKVEKKKEEPKDPPNIAFAKKLQSFLDKNQIKEAIDLFQSLPKELEKDIDFKILLASLYISDKQYDQAIEVANFILQIEPENIDAYELISLALEGKGDKAAQKANADKILEIDPYNVTVNIQKAEDYAMNKKYKLSKQSYKKALKNEPQNVDALFGYAQMSFYTDDLKEAEKSLNSILQLEPKNSLALAYMGKLAADSENFLRATKYVKEAIKYDPTNYDYYLDLGTYYRFQGKYSDAAAAWNKAVEIDPTYFLAYAYLAGSYDEQNDFTSALQNYHKVIETNPKYFYAYESTAILEYHLGNWEASRKYFAEAYKYNKSVSYQLMIAATYFKEKNAFKAKEVLKPLLKTLNKDSLEYAMVRFYHDTYSFNAENSLVGKVTKEQNRTQRGKMLFYMGLYYELNGFSEKAIEYYTKVKSMNAPLFFEYRIAEWGLQ
jgi:tetratricopeptide (TPR) repeat protein